MRILRFLSLRLAVVCLLTLGLMAVGTSTADPAGAGTTATQDEQTMFELVNRERRARGLPAFQHDAALAETSRSWSAKMARDGRLSHDPELTRTAARIEPRWRSVAENVGYAGSVERVHQLLMESSSHRDNILSRDSNRLGIGIVHSSGRVWVTQRFLEGPAITSSPTSGTAGSIVPVFGDWDGDGDSEPGTFQNGTWTLQRDADPNAGTHPSFRFGTTPGDHPVAGDWDGDGDDEPAIHRDGGDWYLRNNSSTTGRWTTRFNFGRASGDVPVAGDWDGDGDDEPAIHRDGGDWYFRNNSSTTGRWTTRINFGREGGDIPVAGDWDHDAKAEPVIYRSGLWYLRDRNDHAGRNAMSYSAA